MKINLIDFGDNSYHFTINVKVNNIDATFLIDTGATNTVVFKRFYEENFDKEISLQKSDIAASASGESMETGSVTIDSIKIENKEVTNFKIGCMDMEHIENIYKTTNKGNIDGMLGADLLYIFKITLNLNKLEFSF
ncbi:MAG: clan AA aspartic protease [Chitinophagales bacterium]|nr:clan AA aspartic protease [Chitinophagales bacterium]